VAGITLCDPIWHVSSSSGEACCELLYPVTLLYFTSNVEKSHLSQTNPRDSVHHVKRAANKGRGEIFVSPEFGTKVPEGSTHIVGDTRIPLQNCRINRE